MKKHLLVAVLVLGAGLASATAQSSQGFSTPTGKRDERIQRRAPEPIRRGEIGAFKRAARGGNPLQLINPLAPRKYYGPPQDTVTANPDFERERYTGHQITGLILYGIVW